MDLDAYAILMRLAIDDIYVRLMAFRSTHGRNLVETAKIDLNLNQLITLNK